jgi:hypothetical protein
LAELLDDLSSLLLRRSAMKDVGLQAYSAQASSDGFDVLSPLRQDQTISAHPDGDFHVSADLTRSLVAFDDSPEDLLDAEAVRLRNRMLGTVNE